jgi:hypothetical protein
MSPRTGSAPALIAAATWLRAWLAQRDAPVQAADVIAAGKQAGHAERSLRRAANAIGVHIERRGFAKGTTWSLRDDAAPRDEQPAQAAEQHDAGQPEQRGQQATTTRRTMRVPIGRRDPYGHYREFAEVTDAQTASQWDERTWNPLT